MNGAGRLASWGRLPGPAAQEGEGAGRPLRAALPEPVWMDRDQVD